MVAKVIVTIDREACLGNQVCIAEASGYFELDAEGRSHVTRAGLTEADLPILENAEVMCPVRAITVTTVPGDD